MAELISGSGELIIASGWRGSILFSGPDLNGSIFFQIFEAEFIIYAAGLNFFFAVKKIRPRLPSANIGTRPFEITFFNASKAKQLFSVFWITSNIFFRSVINSDLIFCCACAKELIFFFSRPGINIFGNGRINFRVG